MGSQKDVAILSLGSALFSGLGDGPDERRELRVLILLWVVPVNQKPGGSRVWGAFLPFPLLLLPSHSGPQTLASAPLVLAGGCFQRKVCKP